MGIEDRRLSLPVVAQPRPLGSLASSGRWSLEALPTGAGIDGDLPPSLPFTSSPFQCVPEVLFLFCKERDRVTKPGGWAGSPRGLFSPPAASALGAGGWGRRVQQCPIHVHTSGFTGTGCCHSDRQALHPTGPWSALPTVDARVRAPNSFASRSGRQGHTKQAPRPVSSA